MAKDIDKIMNDVEHNLNKASIKEANGLSSDKETKALVDNLNDVFDSDYWKKCKKTADEIRKEAMKLYPEYFLPIVAEDPLIVVWERMKKVLLNIKDSVDFEEIKNSQHVYPDLHMQSVLKYLLDIIDNFFINNEYEHDFYKETFNINETIDEINNLIERYNSSNDFSTKADLILAIKEHLLVFSIRLTNPNFYK